ncbi:MAG: radical SAM protein [Desulfamplus sp.]|nr:radical SAM protein [Desulfamplus sp.]
MLLIYPPVAKISEPPPGVAILAGALEANNIHCKVVDANIQAMLWLAKRASYNDNWSKRAITNLDRNISELKNIALYKNIARYSQRVIDFNKAINIAPNRRFNISLSDYTDYKLTPLKSEDLLISAKDYKDNPFYPFFESQLSKMIEEYSNNLKELPTQGRESSMDVKRYSSDYIGISLCYLSQALTAFALAGWIKKQFPKSKIIMGGGLVTSWMSMPTWSNPFKGLIDYMVKGRGEEAVVNLCRQGTEKNKIYQPEYTPNFDFSEWGQYIAPGRIIPLRTSSGCYWNRCRFCPEKAEGNLYKPEKNSKLLDNIQYLVHKYHPDYIHFIDDAISPSFLKSLITQGADSSLQEPKFEWYGFLRFTKELADPDFCNALYRSGCRLLKLGLESGEQAVLDKMEKGTDLTLASNILKCLKKAGIHTYIYLLFGTQFENEADAEQTLNYVVNHSNEMSFINIAIFNLPRFSDDTSTLETSLFSEGDLSLYLNFKHPKGWDRKRVRFFIERKFKKHPEIRKIIKHDPPFFTSNHAIFMM